MKIRIIHSYPPSLRGRNIATDAAIQKIPPGLLRRKAPRNDNSIPVSKSSALNLNEVSLNHEMILSKDMGNNFLPYQFDSL